MAEKPRPESDDLSAEEVMKRLRAAGRAAEGAKPASAGAQPAQDSDELTPDEAMARIRAAAKGQPSAVHAEQFIAEHTLAADETLSHLALKYYGHATPPYWQLIYQANKALIGDNPNRVRPGTLLKIPVLPENMK